MDKERAVLLPIHIYAVRIFVVSPFLGLKRMDGRMEGQMHRQRQRWFGRRTGWWLVAGDSESPRLSVLSLMTSSGSSHSWRHALTARLSSHASHCRLARSLLPVSADTCSCSYGFSFAHRVSSLFGGGACLAPNVSEINFQLDWSFHFSSFFPSHNREVFLDLAYRAFWVSLRWGFQANFLRKSFEKYLMFTKMFAPWWRMTFVSVTCRKV